MSLDYDNVYRLTTITDDASPSDPIGIYTYTLAGEVERLDLVNGTWSECAYDEVGRLASLANYNPQGWVISSNHYVRNKVGCPTQITYADGRHRDYDYDELYRLTHERHWSPQDQSLLWHEYGHDGKASPCSGRRLHLRQCC